MTKTILATIFMGILFFLDSHFKLTTLFHPEKWSILLFFFSYAMLFHRLVEHGLDNRREKFVPFYLATVVLRFILSLVFIGGFLYMKVADQNLFIGNFFALYIFFSLFEISNLYRNLRQNW